MGGRRGRAPARYSIRLLDEGNREPEGERGVAGRSEIGGTDSAARAVPEHEPRRRRLSRWPGKVGPGQAAGSLDVDLGHLGNPASLGSSSGPPLPRTIESGRPGELFAPCFG
jgi:hypothetical protein